MLKEIDRNMTPSELAYEQTKMSSERTAMAMERTAMTQERTAMAIEQTIMAYERTMLTNAQTLLSYTRTAIGLLAAGIGMFEFVNNQTIITLGMLIMLLAPVVEIIGLIHFFLTRRQLKEVLPGGKPAFSVPAEPIGAAAAQGSVASAHGNTPATQDDKSNASVKQRHHHAAK